MLSLRYLGLMLIDLVDGFLIGISQFSGGCFQEEVVHENCGRECAEAGQTLWNES